MERSTHLWNCAPGHVDSANLGLDKKVNNSINSKLRFCILFSRLWDTPKM